MVALTPRRLKQTIFKSKLARNQGASYGYDALAVETNVEEIAGEGMYSYGGGITSFGGMAKSLMNVDGYGLMALGSGLYTLGTGLYPFGMGIFSKIKGLAGKAASSVIRGTTVKQLKNAVMDAGKKKARQILPQILNKVKTEINRTAPELVTRLTSPVLNKLPSSVQGNVKSMLEMGVNKGLAQATKGIDKAQQLALQGISSIPSGSGMYGGRVGSQFNDVLTAPSTDQYADYSDRQLNFMRNFGIQSQRSQNAGEIPKRLVLDKASRSLADSILADRTYNQLKQQELYGQVEAAGGGLMYHSQDWQPEVVAKPKATRKKPGRPKGTTTKGKGIVYL